MLVEDLKTCRVLLAWLRACLCLFLRNFSIFTSLLLLARKLLLLFLLQLFQRQTQDSDENVRLIWLRRTRWNETECDVKSKCQKLDMPRLLLLLLLFTTETIRYRQRRRLVVVVVFNWVYSRNRGENFQGNLPTKLITSWRHFCSK